mmetsp:Transcript_27909/g.93928  ORF Transcript_27909/g.93928 Transcript_27909/m.93928 type:complete len:547 (-) Transcript_27909:60-1700(-)
MCRPGAASRLCGVLGRTNHNVLLNLVVAALTGLADSIWGGTIGVAFIYDVFGESNTKVGLAAACEGLTTLLSALPAGYAADRFRRSRVIAVGGAAMLAAAGLLAYAIVEAAAARRRGRGAHLEFVLICVAFGLFGFANGIINGPAQALLADSVPTGQRSRFYNWLFLAYVIPTFVGPLITIFWFAVNGDAWTLLALRDLTLAGVALQVPVGVLLFCFRDDKALGRESDAIGHGHGAAARESTDAQYGRISMHEAHYELLADDDDARDVRGDRGGNDVKDEAQYERSKGRRRAPQGSSEPLRLDADDDDEPTHHLHPHSWRVPYIVFATDFIIALGSGMTVKFFPLFFKNDCGMSPTRVQCIAVAVSLAMAAASSLGTRLGARVGRVQAVLALRCGGLSCFGAMVVLYSRGIASAAWVKPAVVLVYVLRTALMNCTYPLEESILMDYVPKETRARWKSLESVANFGWAGSALAGGVLADRLGYTRTFVITIILQSLGTFIYASLLGVVVREAASVRIRETPPRDTSTPPRDAPTPPRDDEAPPSAVP